MRLEKRVRALEAALLADPVILYFPDGTTRKIHGPRNLLLDLLVGACGGADLSSRQAEQLALVRQSTHAEEPGGGRLTELLRILHWPAEEPSSVAPVRS